MKFDEQRNMMRLHPSRTDARQGARLSHAHGLCGQDNRPFENDKSVNPFNTKWQGVEFETNGYCEIMSLIMSSQVSSSTFASIYST